MTDRLAQTQGVVSLYMEAIGNLFRPGAKVTVLVRNPACEKSPGGAAFIMTGDDLPSVAQMIARSRFGSAWPTPAEIRSLPTSDYLTLAREIADGDQVMKVYAAVEFDCLDENGQEWLAAIVRETAARATEGRLAREPGA